MRKVKKWVYYCEFCKKSGRSGGHISRHEKSCTMNPDRECRMCATDGFGNRQRLIAELITALGKGDEIGVGELEDAANACPACMLAAIRQSGVQVKWESPDEPGFNVPFDFKKASEQFWSKINDARMEEDMRGMY